FTLGGFHALSASAPHQHNSTKKQQGAKSRESGQYILCPLRLLWGRRGRFELVAMEASRLERDGVAPFGVKPDCTLYDVAQHLQLLECARHINALALALLILAVNQDRYANARDVASRQQDLFDHPVHFPIAGMATTSDITARGFNRRL